MNESTVENQLYLTAESVSHVSVIRKWAFFLSIVGFLTSGLLVVFGLFFAIIMRFAAGESSSLGFIPSAALSLLYIGIGVVYFFPSYYLLRFSTNMKYALATNDAAALTGALKYLKSHYVFLGVGVIVALLLYFFVIVGIIIFAVLKGVSGNV